MSRRIALEVSRHTQDLMADAITKGGGELVALPEAEGLIFLKVNHPERLVEILDPDHPDHSPNLKWIQLPYAGIESYIDLLTPKYVWACGKGVYAPPVAEMAVALLLAGFRSLNTYINTKTWEAPIGKNLFGANILILGGGGIAEEVVKLLIPFGCQITVVRKHDKPLNLPADFDIRDTTLEIKTTDDLPQLYPNADAVILALSLTSKTENIIDTEALAAMPNHCWIINVARGKHIDTEALVAALKSGGIGGAGLDVTEPEPLPDNHPLWELPNCIITPHTANTPEMGIALLKTRVIENVGLFCTGQELLGLVNVELGY